MRLPLALILAACLLAVSAPLFAADNPLIGLWRVEKIKNLATGEVAEPHREFHMYSASHEMIILAGKDRPKLTKSLSDMTAAEVMSQQPVGAGFYEIKFVEPGVLSRTALVTLSAFYEGRTVRTEYELKGGRLITRDAHSADGQTREWHMVRVE